MTAPRESLLERLQQAFRARRAQNSLSTLQDCIDAFRELIPVLDKSKVEHGNAVLDLAQLLGERWGMTRSASDWQDAEEEIDGFRAEIPRGDWREALYALAQGMLLYRRADMTEDLGDISAAIDRLQEARSMVRPGSFVHAYSSGHQGNLRLRRHEASNDPVDLELALEDTIAVLSSEKALRPHVASAAKEFARAVSLHVDLVGSSGLIDLAIRKAEEILTLTVDPIETGDLGAALATLHRQRFARDRKAEDLDRAIELYRLAADRPGMPERLRAACLDNLGNGIAERYRAYGADADLDEMVSCGRKALALQPQGSRYRARTCANFAGSLLSLWDKRRDAAAMSELIAVLEDGLRQKDVPQPLLAVLHGLMLQTLLEADSAGPDGAYLDRAIDAGEASLRAHLSSDGDDPIFYRLNSRSRSASAARRLIGALIRRADKNPRSRDADLRRALVLGEAAKAPLLTRELLRRSLPPPPEASEGQIFFEKQQLAEIAAFDAHELAPANELSEARRLRRIAHRRNSWRALQRVWDEIAATGPAGERYVQGRRDVSAALAAALDQRPSNLLVLSLIETESLSNDRNWQREFCVLALLPDTETPSVLSRGSVNTIHRALDLYAEQSPGILDTDESSETWWLELAPLFRGARADSNTSIMFSGIARGLNLPWHLVLQRCDWLSHDGNLPPVVVIPSLVLAATKGASGEDEWHVLRNVAEHFGIRDEHGLAENLRAAIRMPTAPSIEAVVVGNPSEDLSYANDEAVNTALALGVEPLLGTAASVAAVKEAVHRARIVHIAAHASFNADDPLASVLHLSDGDLSARDLVGSWSVSELVVLSACESGTGRPTMGGEAFGLATELLRAGVGSVIASLWSVDDAATAFLMRKFYVARAEGASTAAALAKAMSETRSQPGWDGPYYWAGFVLVQRGWA